VARTFQNIRLFRELSAYDNVRIGCHHLTNESMAAAVRHGGAAAPAAADSGAADSAAAVGERAAQRPRHG